MSLAIVTHLLWGFFPLYFRLLEPADPVEIIVYRAGWGMVLCFLLLALLGRWSDLLSIVSNRQILWRLSAAGFLIVINWMVYVHAVLSGHTTDAALGYFINPLMTVALGLIVLRERLTFLQKIAVALGALAVMVLIVGLGRFPWVSLVLPLTFALYSLVKKDVAPSVGPIEGMTVETTVVTPFLLGYLAYLAYGQSTSFQVLAATSSSWQPHFALLMGAGVITMIPLFLYAKAAQGLPLGVMGFIQYISPVMQLVIGVWFFRESMEPIRWLATGIIWCALAVLTIDFTRQVHRTRKLLRAAR